MNDPISMEAACALLSMTQPEHLRWAFQPLHHPNLISTGRHSKTERERANAEEKEWGNKTIGTVGNKNWSTKLGEDLLVKAALEARGHVVRKPVKKNGFKPDWETDDAIWEVKTRSWTTQGSAGEKILGTPYKYASVPQLYGKPLRIVCVAYQEHEAEKWGLFGKTGSPERNALLDMFRDKGIEFVRFTDLIVTN